jgi:hypothetical protein
MSVGLLITPRAEKKTIRKDRETDFPATDAASIPSETESDLSDEPIGFVVLPKLEKIVQATFYSLGTLKPMPIPELDD